MSRNVPSLLDGWHTALSSYVDTTESNLKGLRRPSPRLSNNGRDLTPSHRVRGVRVVLTHTGLTIFQASSSSLRVS